MMAAAPPFHRPSDGDQGFSLRVLGEGEGVEVPHGALGQHGLDCAGEGAGEGVGQVHAEFRGVDEHLCVNWRGGLAGEKGGGEGSDLGLDRVRGS